MHHQFDGQAANRVGNHRQPLANHLQGFGTNRGFEDETAARAVKGQGKANGKTVKDSAKPVKGHAQIVK